MTHLKRMGLLKPIVGGRIRAITWKNDHDGLDKLGIIPSARGIQFVKRDDEGKLAGLFVAYTHTPTMFGGRFNGRSGRVDRLRQASGGRDVQTARP
jgi:hypothetical protein